MRVIIGCDPNAEAFKQELIPFIKELGAEVFDVGSVDPIYANTAIKVAEAVVKKEYDRGILICGTGIGVSIAANKVKGAYAALVTDTFQAQRAQLSNNANIITMGAQITGIEMAKCMVREYLSCFFDPNSRSAQKVDRILDYERGK